MRYADHQRIARHQQRPIDISLVAFDLLGFEPTGANDLCQTAGIMSVGLVRHHLQHAARVACIEADDRQIPRNQRVPQLDSQRPGLHIDPLEAIAPGQVATLVSVRIVPP